MVLPSRSLLALCGLLIADCSLLRVARSSERKQKLWSLKRGLIGASPTFVVAAPVGAAPAAAPAAAPVAAPAAVPEAAPAGANATAKAVELPSMCQTQGTNCASCTALAQCGWCASDRKCVDGTKVGPHKEQCLAYDFNFCVNMPCEARNSCTDCTTDRGCGWCAATAKCSGGDDKGPFIASSCPAGFAGKRKVWAHGLAAQKCPSDTTALHSSDLWSGLRKVMYKSQRRIARLSAKTASAPKVPPVQAPATPAPVYVMTTWFYPTTPAPMTTTTVATTKRIIIKTTTVATTLPPITQKPAPPVKIVIDVDQDVENGAHASNPEKTTMPHLAAKENKKQDDTKGKTGDSKKGEKGSDHDQKAKKGAAPALPGLR